MSRFFGYISEQGNMHFAELKPCLNLFQSRGFDDEGFLLGMDDNIRIYGGEATKDEVYSSDAVYTPINPIGCEESNARFSLLLAHKRIATLDLLPAGHQPMSDETGRFWIVYDGMVYNYRDIRGHLKNHGHVFVSNTDTEVVLKSYLQWGDKCVEKFNGEWAFGIFFIEAGADLSDGIVVALILRGLSILMSIVGAALFLFEKAERQDFKGFSTS